METKVKNLKSQAIAGIKWTSISTISVNVFQFVQLVILGRILDPSDFGLMGMTMVVIGFASTFADMGISNAIICKQKNSSEQLSSLYWLNISAGVGVLFVLWATSPLIALFYREPRLTKLLFLAALCFPITSFGQQFQILLQKDLKFNKLAKIDIVSSAIGFLTAIIFAFNGFKVFSLVFAQLSNTATKTILLILSGYKDYPLKIHFNKSDIKGYVGFGLYQMGERTVSYFNSNLDNLLIGSILGAKSLGYYTFAYNLIIMPITKINPIITRVAFPVFAKVQDDLEYLKRGYLKVVKILCFVNFPILIGLAASSPYAITLVFGSKWLPSIGLIQILAGVGLLRSIINPVGSLVLAKGRADLGFKWNLLVFIIQLPGIYIGVNLGGAVGAAIACLSLQILYFIFSYFILIKTLLGSCITQYVDSIWSPLWTCILMGVLVWVVGLIPFTNAYLILCLQVLLGVVIYVVLSIKYNSGITLEFRKMLLSKKM